jgi:hypothetical protein
VADRDPLKVTKRELARQKKVIKAADKRHEKVIERRTAK